ncbi:MAG: lysylphosphatidylglycerol synthase transmembrane domain-containing protein [Candidatus Zixiibacteriota bacterium]
MSATAKKILWRVFQVVLIGVIFYFLGRQLIRNWDKVLAYDWHLNYFYLIAALLSVVLTFYVFSSVWKIIVHSLGKEVGFAQSFKIAYLANLGRYIPGKIWQMFGMIYLAKKEGVTEEEAVASFGLSQIFAIPSGLLSGIVFLSLYPGVRDYYENVPLLTSGMMLIGISIFIVSLIVVFFPKPLERLANWLFGLIKRKPINLRMNKSLAATIYGGYFLAWSLYGFSFWLFVKGITVQEAMILPMAGIFIIAYQIGYLMLFAPGGVGPREAMMELMLAPFFGAGVATAIAIAARLWLITAEAVCAVIALRIKSTEK